MDRSNLIYNPYYVNYVSLVKSNSPMQALEENYKSYLSLIENLTEEEFNFAYAPDKWTLKTVLVHIMDAERVFAYRALRIARGDQTPLPGYDQDVFAECEMPTKRTITDILTEYKTCRASSLSLFKSFRAEDWARVGIASDDKVSVAALAFIIAGHERHHLNILKARYLK